MFTALTLFQWLSLSALLAVILAELWRLRRSAGNWGLPLLRLAVWLAAAAAIAYPRLTEIVASAAGIHRGADLVLYVFVLAFLACVFYYYSRYVRLQRQITEIVRHLALQEAARNDRSN